MPRFRRSIRPVQRIKHVVDTSATLTAGSVLEVDLIRANDAPVLANTAEVITGSTVNGIYLRVEVAGNEMDPGAIPNFYMAVGKNPGGNLSLPDPNVVGASDNKRYIIHQEMVMFEDAQGGNPRTVFNGVIVIPKGYRRMGPNDTLNVRFLTTAVNVALCLQCHYKEFR